MPAICDQYVYDTFIGSTRLGYCPQTDVIHASHLKRMWYCAAYSKFNRLAPKACPETWVNPKIAAPTIDLLSVIHPSQVIYEYEVKTKPVYHRILV